jgi:hypothetical protein
LAPQPYLPLAVTINVPLGIFSEPAPEGQSVILSKPLPGWLPVSPLDVELAKRDLRDIWHSVARASLRLVSLPPLP